MSIQPSPPCPGNEYATFGACRKSVPDKNGVRGSSISPRECVMFRLPGGLCYGYRVRREYDETGSPVRGLRSIDEEEAKTIVWIFQRFVDGANPNEIAAELNHLGTPGPRGNIWQATAIRGHRNRGTGILNNQMYIGKIIFNRQAYRKNPSTERQVSRINDSESLIVGEVPALRIVTDDLWQRAKNRQRKLSKPKTAAAR